MKTKTLPLFLLALVPFFAFSQANFINSHVIDPYNPAYVKNEVLVRFKDSITVSTKFKSGAFKTGQNSLDALLKNIDVVGMSKIFKDTRKLKAAHVFRDWNGHLRKAPQLFNIYRIKFKSALDVKSVVNKLKQLKVVDYAEPNYLIYSDEILDNNRNAKTPGQAVSDSILTLQHSGQNSNDKISGTINDPFYLDGSQWYLDAIDAPKAWVLASGKGVVIAFLDTGVDGSHPDLKDKIWTNPKEVPGNRTDDDHNGYVDDAHGWDFVNNDNKPKDDNSHGTHVAGIAAAATNNGIGIAGVAPDAKIMALKVLQSSGVGNTADLAAAINYAYKNGADVINMSLGTYGESLTVKDALENAYGKGDVLVASAGNDGFDLDDYNPNLALFCASFPACYQFVVGVTASKQNGRMANFSNYDPSGPFVFGNIARGFYQNYEITAPGVGITSTVPGGNYRTYNGTSMACPMVAGAAALMKQYNPSLTGEEIFAKIIHGTNSGVLDVYKSLTNKLVPDLYYDGYTLIDTLPGCDKDGKPDAGETVQLYLNLRNAGGLADSVWSRLRFGEFEDTSTARIIDSTSFIGNMSAYSDLTGKLDPFKIKINPKDFNNRSIVFEYETGSKGSSSKTGSLTLTVQRGQQLMGVMDSILHLTSSNLWIVDSSFRIGTDGILYIDPGTHLIVSKTVTVRGRIIAKGNADSLIVIKGEGYAAQRSNSIFKFQSSNSEFSYVKFLNSGRPLIGNNGSININHSMFEEITSELINSLSGQFTDNIVKNCFLYNLWDMGPSVVKNNLIYENTLAVNTVLAGATWKNNCIINNIAPTSTFFPGIFTTYYDVDTSKFKENSFIGNTNWILRVDGYSEFMNLGRQYWGTNDQAKIRKEIYDFFYNSSLPQALINDRLSRPSRLCHGHVWKVEINGIDPQDQRLDPVGAQNVRFDVYFNRPMDIQYQPKVSFGVREPYMQRMVTDSAQWSSDSTIWTGYYKIGPKTGDGTNTVQVKDARDPEGFVIPPENKRFKFIIQAASAASIDFVATPGIGKVKLEWPATHITDILGYNMYRFHNLTDSTYSDTMLINPTLITDTVYTDFNVISDTTYHYMYKAVGTDLNQTDYSKTIAAKPFSAATGDANGDLAVNVLDVTTIVSYILGENPQPFLQDAADVNYDSAINVLDVIGVVELINGTKTVQTGIKSLPQVSGRKALYNLQGQTLWLESRGNVAALQFRLKTKNGKAPSLMLLQKGFEFAYKTTGNETTGVLYSLTGKTLPEGNIKLLQVDGAGSGNITVSPIFGSDLNGDYVQVLKKGAVQPKNLDEKGLAVSPNPFSDLTQISYRVPEEGQVTLQVINLAGQVVKTLVDRRQPAGDYGLTWNGANARRQYLKQGIYILRLTLNGKMDKEVKVVVAK